MHINLLNLKLLQILKPEIHPGRLRELIFKFLKKATLLVLLIFATKAAIAQCNNNADFGTSIIGCDVYFTSSYTGTGSITHQWYFYNTNGISTPFSSSTAANPVFSFNTPIGNSVFVRHIVTITENGQTQFFTCNDEISLDCLNPCNTYYFYYAADGCNLTITNGFSGGPPAIWDFGDGTPLVSTTSLPSHTYTSSGTFIVTVEYNGKFCSLPVTIDCVENPCCSANFTATPYKNCGTLRLSLTPECKNGTHKWAVKSTTPGQCDFELVGFQSVGSTQDFQITNIDTEVNGMLTISHEFSCTDGTTLTETQTISVLPPGEKGIFIGKDNQSLTQLTDYECVLPGDTYTGTLSAKPVYVAGVIIVNKQFTFNNTDIQFNPGNTGFNITYPILFFGLKDKTVAHGTSHCELWRGLRVSNRGKLECDDATISDALFGVDMYGTSATSLSLNKTIFLENYVGIYFRNKVGNSFTMTETEFNGGTSLRQAGTLLGLATTSLSVPTVTGFTNPTFSTLRGYVGIYSQNAAISLDPLTQGTRNFFTNLNYGILVHNADVSIDGNSHFSNINIAPGATIPQSAAIGLYSWAGTAKTLSLSGTLSETNGGADIVNSLIGVEFRTQIGNSPARVEVQNMDIDMVATGIFLDAHLGDGSFNGNSTESLGFAGIHNNRVHCTLEQDAELGTGSGIVFVDASSTVSKIEIYNNEVILETHSTTDDEFFPPNGNPAAIVAVGNNPFSAIAQGIDEVDIHDNQVRLADDGRLGIILHYFPNGIVRNNRNDANTPGNGIFCTSTNLLVGMGSAFGNNNRFICNDVEATSNPKTSLPLQFAWGTTNAEFIRNLLSGPGRGMYFNADCMNAEIRCNTMSENTIGMFYDFDAITGNQGEQNEASGNVWEQDINDTQWLAYHENSIENGIYSQYYVRPGFNIGTTFEQPIQPLFFPDFNWFRNVIPANSPVVCNSDECPVTPAFLPPVISNTDSIVALVEGNFTDEVRWQLEFNLYRKLYENPFLAQTDSLMGAFMNEMSGSMTASFIQLQANMRTAFQPSDASVAEIDSNNMLIKAILLDIANLNTMISTSTDSVIIDSLYLLITEKDSLIDLLQNSNEQLAGQYNSLKSTVLANLVSQANGFVPTNICETNLKSVYIAYLQSIPVSTVLDSATMQEVKAIAEQCYMEGGIGVAAARALYIGLGGKDLDFNNCSSERGVQRNQNSNFSPEDGIILFPNPTDGATIVMLSEKFSEKTAFYNVSNTLGTQVLSGEFIVSSAGFQLNLMNQPKGTYFVSVQVDGTNLKSIPVIIR